MADNPQNQTAATASTASTQTPVAKDSPSSTAGTKAAQTQTPAPTGDPLTDALNAAFAEAEPPKKDTKQATATEVEEELEEADDTEESPEIPEGEQQQAQDPNAEEAQQTTMTDEEVEAAVASDEIDPEQPPKGLEGVPKGVWKRLQKQSAAIRELKAQQAENFVRVQPTAASPLADVADLDTLSERNAAAKATAKELRAMISENPEGWTEKVRGKEIEVTPEAAAARLARAEAEIDAAPDAKEFILERQRTQPAQQAAALVPQLFEKGAPENQYLQYRLAQCPELASKIPDFELMLAHANIGAKQAWEVANKKAIYVRYELDKDGKPIAPKVPLAGGAKPGAAKPGAAKPKAPVAPAATRPAMKAAGAKTTQTTEEVLKAMPADIDPEEKARRLVEAAFA